MVHTSKFHSATRKYAYLSVSDAIVMQVALIAVLNYGLLVREDSVKISVASRMNRMLQIRDILFFAELPIEKDICKHGTGRCFVFTRFRAEEGFSHALPSHGCKSLHWLHGMSDIIVNVKMTQASKDFTELASFSYHFIHEVSQGNTDEMKMQNIVLALVTIVIVLTVAIVAVVAKMCYMSQKYQRTDKGRTTSAISMNEPQSDAGNTSQPANPQDLLLIPDIESNQQVVSNSLYNNGTHLYEDARF